MYADRVDQTLRRIAMEVKALPSVKMGGYVWYDVTNQSLGAEVKALRLAGMIAHHPVVHELIRFEERG